MLAIFAAILILLLSSSQPQLTSSSAAKTDTSLIRVLTDLQRVDNLLLPHWGKNVVYSMDELLFRLQRISMKRPVRLLLVGPSRNSYVTEIETFSRYFHHSIVLFIVNPNVTQFHEMEQLQRENKDPNKVHFFGVPPSGQSPDVGDAHASLQSVLGVLGIYHVDAYKNHANLFDFLFLSDDSSAQDSPAQRRFPLDLYMLYFPLVKPSSYIFIIHNNLQEIDIPDLDVLCSSETCASSPSPDIEETRKNPSETKTLIEYLHYYADLLNYFFHLNAVTLESVESFHFVWTRNLLFEEGLTIVQKTKVARSTPYKRIIVGTEALVYPSSLELAINWKAYYSINDLD